MTFAVKRILNHTYVSVPGAGRDEDSYERNVLAANRIPGLLTCRVEHLDGKTMLLFDVTSRQSLAVYLEKRRITAEMLRVILTGILRTAERLEEYLLDPGHFVLKPAYVFLDAGAKETGLIYDTGYEGDFFEGLKELTGVLMANVPEDDHEAILLGYRISHELDAPAKDVTVLLGLLAGNAGRETQNEADLYAADPCEPYPEGRMDLFGEGIGTAGSSPEEKPSAEKEKRRRPTWLYGAAVVLAGLLLVLLIYAYRSLLPAYPELNLPPWLLILPAAAVGGAFLLLILRRSRKAKERTSGERALPEFRPEDDPFKESLRGLYVSPENEPPAGASPYSFPGSASESPETQILSAPDRGASRRARLIPEERDGGNQEIRLTGTEIRIGKLPEAVDAVIASPVISRIHARVIRRENGWFLEDLNSRNGTYVNGKLTAPGGTPLSDGDKVRFADEGFIFRIQ